MADIHTSGAGGASGGGDPPKKPNQPNALDRFARRFKIKNKKKTKKRGESQETSETAVSQDETPGESAPIAQPADDSLPPIVWTDVPGGGITTVVAPQHYVRAYTMLANRLTEEMGDPGWGGARLFYDGDYSSPHVIRLTVYTDGRAISVNSCHRDA
ncbi:hypothetical protein PG987_016629 [Apiospora arundinis]